MSGGSEELFVRPRYHDVRNTDGIQLQLFWCHACKSTFQARLDSQFSGKCGCGSQFIELINSANDPRDLYRDSQNSAPNNPPARVSEIIVSDANQRPPEPTMVLSMTIRVETRRSRPESPLVAANQDETSRSLFRGRLGDPLEVQRTGRPSTDNVDSEASNAENQNSNELDNIHRLQQELEESILFSQAEDSIDRIAQNPLVFSGEGQELQRFQSGFQVMMELGRLLAESEPGM